MGNALLSIDTQRQEALEPGLFPSALQSSAHTETARASALADELHKLSDKTLYSSRVCELWRTRADGAELGFSDHLALQALDLSGLESVLCLGERTGGIARAFAEQGKDVLVSYPHAQAEALGRARGGELSNIRHTLSAEHSDTEAPRPLVVANLAGRAHNAESLSSILSRAVSSLEETGTLILLVDNPAHSLWSGERRHRSSVEEAVSFDDVSQLLSTHGFRHVEGWGCYPNVSVPLAVINERAWNSNQDIVRALVHYGLSFSLGGVQPDPTELQALCSRGLGVRLAPGWVIVAHRHRVHRVVSRGEIALRFVYAASNAELVRHEWRMGGDIRTPDGQTVIAHPNREVLLSLSEALPSFRSYGVLVHEISVVRRQLTEARDSLRIKTEGFRRESERMRALVEESRRAHESLADRIENLVSSEERAIRMVAAAKEELRHLEEYCRQLEDRRDKLVALSAQLTARVNHLAKPRYERSWGKRVVAAGRLLLTGVTPGVEVPKS
jgi:hypothetical protein